MKYDYDFSREVTYPKQAIDRLGEIIYNHAQRVWGTDGIPVLSENDETEVMTTLFGIARLAEINVRIAWETFCLQEGLPEEASPTSYTEVLRLVDKYIENDPTHWLFHNALTVTDGMLHGNFYQAYIQSQKAYERPDLNLVQDRFIKQAIATFTSTGQNLTFDAKTGAVTTSAGDSYPHSSYVPSKSKTIEANFQSFYVAVTFVPVFDVLLTAFNSAYHFRKCVSSAQPKQSENGDA